MAKIPRLAKSKRMLIACAVCLALMASVCLNWSQIRVRQHLRLISLRGIENIRCQFGTAYDMPVAYIGFDNADEALIQKIVDRLSLEESSTHLYAGTNPPVWWPEEITGRGEWEEVNRIGKALRESGDLITYDLTEDIVDVSRNRACIIEIHHYPKKKQTFYVKRWVGVFVP